MLWLRLVKCQQVAGPIPFLLLSFTLCLRRTESKTSLSSLIAPAGRVIQMPMPIAAEASAKADVANYWGKGLPLKGVRIHSESNDIEAPIEVASSVSLLAEGLSLPWPFPWRSNQASDSVALQGGDLPFPYFLGKIPQLPWPISSALIGKTLRVYHTGDPLTDDHRPDRANIELSPATQRIVAVWFG